MYLGPGNEPVSRKPTDRRRDRRLPMNAAVSKLDPRATTPVSDLSASGVFVHTADPLPIGSEIELKFTVHLEEPVLFEARGRVVRHGATGEPIGMGVEFIELDDSMRDVLKKLELKAEADRARPTLAHTDPGLRTHGLVARLVGSRE
jgi:Tfp pilus assembly protein PilZ